MCHTSTTFDYIVYTASYRADRMLVRVDELTSINPLDDDGQAWGWVAKP
jgi:hypothetical protein